MASTYSPILRTELIGNGDQAGTWGATTNSNFQYIFESAIAGYQLVTISSTNQVLTYTNGPSSTGSLDQSIFAILKLTGTSTASNLFAPPVSKRYTIWNATSAVITVYNSTIIGNTTAAGSGIAIPANAKLTIWSDGTNFYENNYVVGNFTVGGTITAVTQFSGPGTGLTGTAAGLNVGGLSSTLVVGSGGTGATTLTGLVVGNGTSAMTAVAAPSGTVVGTTDTQTITNKTITARVSSTTSITSPLADNSDSFDEYVATAQAANFTISADAGTPTDGRKLIFRVTSDATPRVVTFTGGVSKGFKPVGVFLTTSGSDFTYTLTASKTTYFGAIYSTASARWEIVALSQEV